MRKINGARIRKAGNGFIVEPEYDYNLDGPDEPGMKNEDAKPMVATSIREAFKCAAKFLGGGLSIEESTSPHAEVPEELY